MRTVGDITGYFGKYVSKCADFVCLQDKELVTAALALLEQSVETCVCGAYDLFQFNTLVKVRLLLLLPPSRDWRLLMLLLLLTFLLCALAADNFDGAVAVVVDIVLLLVLLLWLLSMLTCMLHNVFDVYRYVTCSLEAATWRRWRRGGIGGEAKARRDPHSCWLYGPPPHIPTPSASVFDMV